MSATSDEPTTSSTPVHIATAELDMPSTLTTRENEDTINFDEFNELMRETNYTSARLIKTLEEISNNLECLADMLREEQKTPTQMSTALKKNDKVRGLLNIIMPRIKQIKNEPLNHCKALVGHLTFLQLQNEDWRKNTHLAMLKYLGDTTQTSFSKTPAHIVPLHATRWREDSSNNYRHHLKHGDNLQEAQEENVAKNSRHSQQMEDEEATEKSSDEDD